MTKSCSICGYVATMPSYLIRHLNQRHSDLRPYQCNICNASFKTVSVLNTHLQRHSHLYHTCFCGFKTKMWKVFVVHQKIHQERTIQCPHCSYRCRRSEDLRKHKLAMHSGKLCRKFYEQEISTILTDLNLHSETQLNLKANQKGR